MGAIAVTGSVAFDTIMVFPGRFGEHILPERTHVLNVSFLVDRIEKRRGGTAANICYSLALLGERPLLCAAVGGDFGGYGGYAEWLEDAGVDLAHALRADDMLTGAAFITTDLDDNQITAFYPGAMSRAVDVDLRDAGDLEWVVVSPDAPDAMAAHIDQAATLHARLLFAPAQQLPALSDDALRTGLDAATVVAGNDYELELIRSRTGRGVDELRDAGTAVALTLGAQGSELHVDGRVERIPPAPVDEVVDPTGAGDAYVAGLLAGMRAGHPPAVAGRMASLAAAYVVERNGTQAHRYTASEFADRYRAAFGSALAGRA